MCIYCNLFAQMKGKKCTVWKINTVVAVLGVKFLPVCEITYFDTLHGELPQSVYACMQISQLNFYNC